MPRKLEIGGGSNPLDNAEYEQLNDGIENFDNMVIWGKDALPFNDNTFEEVYAAHVIEHIPWWNVRAALKEAVRVLAPGGALEVHTVDFEVLVRRYLDKSPADGWKARGRNQELHPFSNIISRLFCVGTSPSDPMWHRGMFDYAYLVELFQEAGLGYIQRVKEPKGREKHGTINVGIRGVK